MATFASRLRALREERGLTQAELGAKFGLSKQAISTYETGGSSPDKDTLVRIADFFGVSVDYLLGRTDVRQPAPARTSADDELDRAIVALRGRLSPEDREEILKFIEWVKERNRRRREQEKK